MFIIREFWPVTNLRWLFQLGHEETVEFFHYLTIAARENGMVWSMGRVATLHWLGLSEFQLDLLRKTSTMFLHTSRMNCRIVGISASLSTMLRCWSLLMPKNKRYFYSLIIFSNQPFQPRAFHLQQLECYQADQASSQQTFPIPW